jgi:cysteine desulfurase
MQSIYLDNNSTTPIHPSVASAMQECFAAGFVNPASQHRMGQHARRAIEQHRANIANMLGATTSGMQTDQLIFTSGGTESNNLALIGIALSRYEQRKSEDPDALPGRVLISAIEHPSIVGAAEQLARLGFDVRKIEVDQSGVCKVDSLRDLIKQTPIDLVSVMLANNETGVLQPLDAITVICREQDIPVHTDAVQAVAKIPVDFTQLGVDAMSFTAHKFSGPRGIGGLLVRSGVSVQPILFGGFQQMAIRPGTEDVAAVAGMSRALELFHEEPTQMERIEGLRDQLERELVQGLDDAVVVGHSSGGKPERVPHTLNIALTGIDRQAFLLAADFAGLAISTGSACASGSSELSPVLLAMGLPKDVIEGSIRISLGVSNTEAEIVEAARRIIKISNDLRQSK